MSDRRERGAARFARSALVVVAEGTTRSLLVASLRRDGPSPASSRA